MIEASPNDSDMIHEHETSVNQIELNQYILSMHEFLLVKTDFKTKLKVLQRFLLKEVLSKEEHSTSYKFLWVVCMLFFEARGNIKSNKFRNELISLLLKGSITILGEVCFFFDPLLSETTSFTQSDDSLTNNDCYNEIEKSLIEGDKEAALFISCKHQLWPICFLIAQQIGQQAQEAHQ